MAIFFLLMTYLPFKGLTHALIVEVMSSTYQSILRKSECSDHNFLNSKYLYKHADHIFRFYVNTSTQSMFSYAGILTIKHLSNKLYLLIVLLG